MRPLVSTLQYVRSGRYLTSGGTAGPWGGRSRLVGAAGRVSTGLFLGADGVESGCREQAGNASRPVTKSGRKKQGQRIVGVLRVGTEAGSPSAAQPAASTQPIHRDRGNPTAKTQIPSPNHSGVDERLQEYGSLVDEALPRSGLG